MNQTTKQMKEELIKRIESSLGWGSSADWTNKDFTCLSEKIFKKTNKQLSVTTLKRVWGRVETQANTSTTTLDILAQFLEYENWRAFTNTVESINVSGKKNYFNNAIKVTLVLVLLGFVSSFFWMKKATTNATTKTLSDFDIDKITFSFNKITTGYPNTVVFDYDFGNITYNSISIQQSWDSKKRIPLTKSKGIVTSTYYKPGYYLTKLIADDIILKEKELYIPTNGWQGMLLKPNEEMEYIPDNIIQKKSGIQLDSVLKKRLLGESKKQLYVANLKNNPIINGGNFVLNTKFRLLEANKKSICKSVGMTITGTRNVVGLAFTRAGCVGDISFLINRERISGKLNDLSAFAIEPGEWLKCKVVVKDNNSIEIYLNDSLAYKQQLTSYLGNIGGVQYVFEGVGEIDVLQILEPDSIGKVLVHDFMINE